jgi:hypothetical protein
LNEVKEEEVKEENGCESLESRTGKRRSESESPRAREASKWVTREPYYYYESAAGTRTDGTSIRAGTSTTALDEYDYHDYERYQ